MRKEKSLDRNEFFVKIKKIKEENPKGQLSVLIGNGFGLSHPELGDAFKWDMHAALCHSWRDSLPKKSTYCPETDLEAIRVNVLKKILIYYIKNLFFYMDEERKSSNNHHKSNKLYKLYNDYEKIRNECHSKDFLSGDDIKWDNIFTLNYDPILYFEILAIISEEQGNGFRGDRFIDQEEIINRLKQASTKIFYLHGAWFIQVDETDKQLRKLSFEKSKNYTVKKIFEDGTPYLVLEDRWRVKKALLEADCNPYLKHCYDQLKGIDGALLVFGCSFKRDNHILQALLIDNEKLDRIYITYRNKKDREAIEKELKKAGEEGIAANELVYALRKKVRFEDKGDSLLLRTSYLGEKTKTIEFIPIEEDVVWLKQKKWVFW